MTTAPAIKFLSALSGPFTETRDGLSYIRYLPMYINTKKSPQVTAVLMFENEACSDK